MHEQLLLITEELESADRALADGYHPEQLYILRVRMRRIRSIGPTSTITCDRN